MSKTIITTSTVSALGILASDIAFRDGLYESYYVHTTTCWGDTYTAVYHSAHEVISALGRELAYDPYAIGIDCYMDKADRVMPEYTYHYCDGQVMFDLYGME